MISFWRDSMLVSFFVGIFVFRVRCEFLAHCLVGFMAHGRFAAGTASLGAVQQSAPHQRIQVGLDKFQPLLQPFKLASRNCQEPAMRKIWQEEMRLPFSSS